MHYVVLFFFASRIVIVLYLLCTSTVFRWIKLLKNVLLLLQHIAIMSTYM